MKGTWILALVASFVAGTIVSGVVVFADDDDELSELVCGAGQAMTGILFEDDDEIVDILCGAQLQGPKGDKGDKGDKGETGPAGQGLSCQNQRALFSQVSGFVPDPSCFAPLSVNAGPDHAASKTIGPQGFGCFTTLNGSVSGGAPTVTVQWTVVSGPGIISAPNSLSTLVGWGVTSAGQTSTTFKLTATDGLGNTADDTATITCIVP